MKTYLRIFLIAAAVLLPSGVSAQTDIEQQKKFISSIKKSDKYLYAETTMKSPKEASETTLQLLAEEIKAYVATKKKEYAGKIVIAQNTASSTHTVSLPRGNMYRAFAYIKKDDVVGVPTAEKADVAGVPTANTPSETTTTVATTVVPIVDQTEQKVVNRLLQAKTAKDALTVLKQLKRERLVSEITSPSKVSYPESYVLVIYDQDNNVSAVLHSGKPRINARTKQQDATSNYDYKGIIAVK